MGSDRRSAGPAKAVEIGVSLRQGIMHRRLFASLYTCCIIAALLTVLGVQCATAGGAPTAEAPQPSFAVKLLAREGSAALSSEASNEQLLFDIDPITQPGEMTADTETLRQFDFSVPMDGPRGSFKLVFKITSPAGDLERAEVAVTSGGAGSGDISSPRIPAESKVQVFAAAASPGLEGLAVRSIREVRRTSIPLLTGAQDGGLSASIWTTLGAIKDTLEPAAARAVIENAYGAIAAFEGPRLSCTDEDTGCDPVEYCTAFRIGPALFATAWHCMADFAARPCDGVRLRFNYAQTGTRAPLKTVEPLIEEHCKALKYLNPNIDLALFEVTENAKERWAQSPILKFARLANLENKPAYPYAGQKLAILHYPATDSRCRAPRDEPVIGVPYGVRVSVFGEPGGRGDCRVLGYERDRSGRCTNPRTGRPSKCISWASMFRRDAADATAYGRPWLPISKFHKERPLVAFRHQCATCGGSSGAPVISLTADEPGEFGAVIGIHQGQTFDEKVDGWPANNISIRTSAIADCIDIVAVEQGTVSLKFEHKDNCICKFPAECAASAAGWSAAPGDRP